jgi:hypothetical protein
MPEVYTCDCGGKTWTIYGQVIECNHCKNEYRPIAYPDGDGYYLESAKSFNNHLKERPGA